MSAVRIPVQMRFGDVDCNGHINNVAQVRFLEEARVRVAYHPVEIPGRAAPACLRELLGPIRTIVGRQEIEYQGELEYRQEPIEVLTWVSHVSGSSFVENYRLQEPGGEQVHSQAQCTVVLIDPETRKTASMDQEVQDLLAQLADEPLEMSHRPQDD